MHSLCETGFLLHKFYDFLIKTFYNLKQSNNFFDSDISLDLTIKFLSIITNAVSHFFQHDKNTLARYLSKISLKLPTMSLYKNHPDIIHLTLAIKNNLSCIYEKEKQYNKSISELNYCKQYLSNNIDKIIFYNNIIRILYRTSNDSDKYYSLWKGCLYEEMDNIKSVKVQKLQNITNDKGIVEIIQLISFSSFNYAYHMEINKRNINEAKEMYKKGYEFSLSMLNEDNYYVEKFKWKVEVLLVNQNLLCSALSISEDDEVNLNMSNEGNLSSLQSNQISKQLEDVLLQLENISGKIDSGEYNKKENENLIEHTKEIKEMIMKINVIDKKKKLKKRDQKTGIGTEEKFYSLDISNKKKQKIPIKSKTPIKKEHILCKDIDKDKDRNDVKMNKFDNKINKFYSSDEYYLDFHTNISQVNLLQLDSPSDNSRSTIRSRGSSISRKSSSIPKLQIDQLEEETKYEAETYFQLVSDYPPKIVVQEIEDPIFEFITFYTPVGDTNQKTARSVSGTEFFESCNKIKNEIINIKYIDFDVNIFFDSLIKVDNCKEEIRQIRYIKNTKFIIKLIPDKLGISLHLIKSIDKSTALISNFTYFKLKQIISKLMLFLTLKPLHTFNSITTIADLTREILINFISIRYNDGYKFGISQKMIGVFLKKSINLKICHCICIFDIFIISKNKARIFLYSSTKGENIIYIDAKFDDKTFDSLFKEDTDCPEIFLLESEDYSQDNNVITLGKNIQKLVNSYCFSKYSSFEELCAKKFLTFYCEVYNNCNDITLRIAEFQEKIFKVIELNSKSSIKNDGIIYSCDLKQLFGYELNELVKKTDVYDKIFLSQIILQSIIQDQKTSKLALYPFELKEKFVFCEKGRVCYFELIKIKEYKYIKLLIYHPLYQQEEQKLYIIYTRKGNINDYINSFTLERYQDQLKQTAGETLHRLSKGTNKFIDILYV